jgi:branched-chain amino acid transport system ATP-binding protein
MAELLQLKKVRAGYGETVVLEDVELALPHDGALAVLGRNGVGKTTLLSTIMGHTTFHSGEVLFNGRPIHGLPVYERSRLGIGFVPQERLIFPSLDVDENLSVAARPGRWNAERVYDLFPRLKERRSAMGNQLSGGEQQMLAIGRALMTNPHLLILDEATEGLAPLIREEIWRCLAGLKAAGQTILVIDKYIERLVRVADRHTIIERGRVAWQGSSAALGADRGLWHRYLGV